MNSLRLFSEPTRQWFIEAFPAPTVAQSEAWAAISKGENVLVVAPTGSGKTLAAFLWSIDRIVLTPQPDPEKRLRVLYVSPLKALAVDIDRNLRAPLRGISNVALRIGSDIPEINTYIRTGDTPYVERRKFVKTPPDILITTPESLYLMLTSSAREVLRNIDTVIVDEVHSIVSTKRGSHLAISLERLDELLEKPARRIGLSATVRPLNEIAHFLGGSHDVTVVAPRYEKEWDLKVVVPVEDMTALDLREPDDNDPMRKSIWPDVEESLVDLIKQHRSTIIFVNSRGLAERLCHRINERAGEDIARSHHGSVSREQRKQIEDDLKAGNLPAVVATSSLELGIDMGAVDLVVQVEAPPSVASGLQRIGRAGHQVGATSSGTFFPKFRGDLLECAVVIERMRAGLIEEMSFPRNPLDVLAQQIVAMASMDEWNLDDLSKVIRRAAPFASLPDSALESVLDMLSGRFPSDEFAELRARINWDRTTNALSGRPSAKRLAVTNGGTIPDRGLYGVFLASEKPVRVGELDEEMVYESRVGDVFVLGTSSWRIEEMTPDRVIVSPAPGEGGRLPFWHGDAPGRPIELGRAQGKFLREVARSAPALAMERLEADGLDDFAAKNLIAYLQEQKDSTGTLPDDRTIVVERFRDEIGDWRLCIHTPFGARVHAPWALAIETRIRDRLGVEVQTMYTDDGIVVRLPESDEVPASDWVIFDPEEIESIVTDHLGGSALFASRFRECAARALLLPKRNPGKRTPLWQQRQKSYNLLQVASNYGSFPVVLEAVRECLQDVFDLPALKGLMLDFRDRTVQLVEVETNRPSPFASSLLFGYVAAFLYEGDAPLAEKRAQALSLDPSLLAELLGTAELRELLNVEVIAEAELELQRLTPTRKIRGPDDLHDVLRNIGDLAPEEIKARGGDPSWLLELEQSRRAIPVRIAGEERWIAIEDAARVRDALGVALPQGIPEVFNEPVANPLIDLVSRFARTHGPFHAQDVSRRLGIGVAVVDDALKQLEKTKRIIRGEFHPGGSLVEWCDADVLRLLRRRSLALLRKEAEPVEKDVLARFYLSWQGIDGRNRGLDALVRVVEQLQGIPIPGSMLESLVLPQRVKDYTPSMLDQLCSSGEVIWAGSDSIGLNDGWVSLFLAHNSDLLLPYAQRDLLSDFAQSVADALTESGALFFRQIAESVGASDDRSLLDAIWECVWAGYVTNDTLAPLRAFQSGSRSHSPSRSYRRRPQFPSRVGPPSSQGRWSRLPEPSGDSTLRAHALAEQLLDRHGIVTRGAVTGERVSGGFAAAYSVLKVFEEAGRCRRGYFVEGLGAAQFALQGAVDRLRGLADPSGEPTAVVLAATDPANPYGGALPWPERFSMVEAAGQHRPGRKPGALVVLVEGRLVLYVERGGKTMLTWSEDHAVLQPAVDALAISIEGGLGRLAVERADGAPVLDTALARVLESAGFRPTSRGLRLRG